MAQPMLDLSIIVVNYNAKLLLQKCLQTLFENTKHINFEVFVVDNNSKDASQEFIKLHFPQIKLISNKKNVGFAKANNQAIKKSIGRNILLLNPDTEIIQNTFYEMVMFLDNNLNAGAVGCKLLNTDYTLQFSLKRFPTLLNTISRRFRLEGKKPFFHSQKFVGTITDVKYYNRLHTIEFALGACLMVKRNVLLNIGLLDEQFFLYGEEIDLCYRIQKYGWKVYYLPNISIIHHRNKTTEIIDNRNLIISLRQLKSEYLFIAKYHNLLYTRIYKTVITAKILLSIFKNAAFKQIKIAGKGDQYSQFISKYIDFLKWFFNK